MREFTCLSVLGLFFLLLLVSVLVIFLWLQSSGVHRSPSTGPQVGGEI